MVSSGDNLRHQDKGIMEESPCQQHQGITEESPCQQNQGIMEKSPCQQNQGIMEKSPCQQNQGMEEIPCQQNQGIMEESPCQQNQGMEEIPHPVDGQFCESGEDNTRLQLALFRLARDLRNLFLEMANKLDRHHRNVNIARVAGGTVATVGGAVAIGAGIAIPFTFGISVILAIVGGAVAATGGVTAGGAGIFKYIINKRALKEAETKWYIFCNMYVKVHHLQQQRLNNNLPADGVQAAAGFGAAGAAGLGLVARETLVAAGGAGGRTAATAARLAAATASVTVLVNVILLGFSLYDIIDGSLELHRERKSPAGDIMRKLARELDDLIDDVDDSLLTGDLLDSDLLIDGDLRFDWY